jgi:2-polyprenyl-3-methyl-5-hydroxy-6-metoxy-1,4-benzoquinol methylase
MSTPGSTTAGVPPRDPAGKSQSIGSLFDDVAAPYNRIAEWMSRAPGLHDWLNSTMLPGGRRAIDVGCGNGRFCPLLAEHYEEVLGVDVADALLAVGRRDHSRPNVRYERRSAHDVTAERDGRFDLVFSYSAVFHMRPYDQILPHLRSLTAPGGRLIVFEPEQNPGHERKGEDEDWLTDAAFQNARTAYRMTGSVQAATDVLDLFFHPSWQELSRHSSVPSREEFRQAYSLWFPGVEFVDGVVPAMGVALWQAPAG